MTTQGLTVVDDNVDPNVVIMTWGVMRQPVYTAMEPKQALQLAADLIVAANRRLPRQPDAGNEQEK